MLSRNSGRVEQIDCAGLRIPHVAAGLPPIGLLQFHADKPAALLERAIMALPGLKVRVRSDSAGFQSKVVRVLWDRGADFTITMRKDENVMDSIYGIPEAKWQVYTTPYVYIRPATDVRLRRASIV